MATFLRKEDVDRSVLSERRVAIIGYGSQGHAHALNLRDSGIDVVVGLREGSSSRRKAEEAGLRVQGVADAAAESDVVVLLLPDTEQPAVFERDIRPHLAPGNALGFAHGFNIRFGTIVPPADVDVVMVAPSGPGHMLRRAYTEGGGLATLLAVAQDSTGNADALVLAYADAIGSTRAVVFTSTFAEETETDLFGEQVVLCGGIVELAASAFDTLVAAGYRKEAAYFECVHQMKLIVDLIFEQGIEGMRFSISDTAEYGGLTRGPRVIGEQSRAEMRRVLDEIRDGTFAAEWIAENANGRPILDKLRAVERGREVERVGDELLSVIPTDSRGEGRFEDSSGG